jgi:phosphatidylglycerol:prolipoprotein diacylglycerol transferase
VLPFHVRLGPFGISPVELFAVAGIVLAGFLARRKMSPQPTWGGLVDLILAAILGGAVGARLFHFVPLWIRGLEPASRLFSDWSRGSGFLGGLLGGTAAVLAVARLKKLAPFRLADAVGVYIPLGFASGKFGCFLAGCCYGPRRDGFPGMSFAPGSLAYETQLEAHEIAPGALRSLPVHPTQLYELALGILLFLGLRVIHRRSKHPGETYLAYVLGYSLWRFVIEFFRSDPGRQNFGATALSDSQISSMVLSVLAVAGWVFLRTRKPEGEPPPTPK